MRLGISGTYSSGKTLTSYALSHYTGMPRTRARTMREILPEAAPGRTLEECTSAQLLQMIVVRHTERVVHESRLSDGFISDGSSLQEWIYGSVRVRLGINPNSSAGMAEGEAVPRTPEIEYFEQVISELGKAFKRHVRSSFDAFVHLRNELPLSADGHRPVNEQFRSLSDTTLAEVMTELGIPFHVVGGDIATRLTTIVSTFDLPTVVPVERAVELAYEEYEALDVRDELTRVPAPV